MMSIHCPVCRARSEHRILREAADLLVQCAECGHIHHVAKPSPPMPLQVRAVVSREGESSVCSVDLLDSDTCAVGDLIVAECGDEAVGVEITAIEAGERRLQRARASDVTTLWTRAVEQVVVKISVHAGRQTLPLYQVADGEQEYVVGGIYTIGGRRFRISHIKLRDGPVLRKEGWKAFARRIKRIYATRV